MLTHAHHSRSFQCCLRRQSSTATVIAFDHDSEKAEEGKFSEAEVNVLVEVVVASYSTLFGKFSPSLTNSMKTLAWEDIGEKYEIMSELILAGVLKKS